MILGTPDHMAPEQARGRPVDRRADIFSFGVVLYEMLTGFNPFRGKSQVDTLSAILTVDPAPVSTYNLDLPPELDELVAAMLVKQPDHRTSSVGEVREALARVASSRTSSSSAPSTSPAAACRSCGALNLAGQKFCGSCSEKLDLRSDAAPAQVPLLATPSTLARTSSSSRPPGERRQLSILSCGLADFASLSEWLDPEELHTIVMSYRQICSAAASEFGGSMAPPSHRSLQIYFGYPVAFEDNWREQSTPRAPSRIESGNWSRRSHCRAICGWL